jgi:hypothetical protein
MSFGWGFECLRGKWVSISAWILSTAMSTALYEYNMDSSVRPKVEKGAHCSPPRRQGTARRGNDIHQVLILKSQESPVYILLKAVNRKEHSPSHPRTIMETGLFNLRLDGEERIACVLSWLRLTTSPGKWHCKSTPRRSLCAHRDQRALSIIEELIERRAMPEFDLRGWPQVPCPIPLHSKMDYVYTIDLDSGYVTIRRWLRPSLVSVAVQISIERIQEPRDLNFQRLCDAASWPRVPDAVQIKGYWLSRREKPSLPDLGVGGENLAAGSTSVGTLAVKIGPPSPLNQLQYRLFADFVSQWQSYLDDPSVTQCPIRYILCTAFLRLAAWDFDVVVDGPPIPALMYNSIPSWKYPEAEIYWFHGFLVVQYETLETESFIPDAISRARLFLGNERSRPTHAILISPRHVAFLELAGNNMSCSPAIPLITDRSTVQPSPGFCILVSILTSSSWKPPYRIGRESWDISLPPEILRIIITEMEPRDAVSFARASARAEQLYYSLIPRFGDFCILSFEKSIPCCGKPGVSAANGVYCQTCYLWYHNKCIGIDRNVTQYLCSGCAGDNVPLASRSGDIARASGRLQKRRSSTVRANGKPKLLQLRTWGIALPRAPDVPILQANYAIRFSGALSGLAYGLEDCT